MEYRFDMESILDTYVHGKRVALIGRAQELRSLQQGEFIDSHDVVVRINNPVPFELGEPREGLKRLAQSQQWIDELLESPYFVPPQYHQYVGLKTSIYFLNDKQLASKLFHDEAWCRKIAHRLVSASCWHIIISQPAKLQHLIEQCTKLGITLTYDGNLDIWNQTKKKTGSSPNGGTMAVSLFSEFEFSSLYLTGFSKHATNKSNSNHNGDTTHDFQFIKSLVERDERITTDSEMECQIKAIK